MPRLAGRMETSTDRLLWLPARQQSWRMARAEGMQQRRRGRVWPHVWCAPLAHVLREGCTARGESAHLERAPLLETSFGCHTPNVYMRLNKVGAQGRSLCPCAR